MEFRLNQLVLFAETPRLFVAGVGLAGHRDCQSVGAAVRCEAVGSRQRLVRQPRGQEVGDGGDSGGSRNFCSFVSIFGNI